MDAAPRPGAVRVLGLSPLVLRFAVVGAFSALAYFALYVLLRGPLGPQAANLVALVLSALANTAVNRRVTFAVRGGSGAVRHHLQGLVVFAAGWAITSAPLWALTHSGADSPAAEVVVLVAATVVATAARFALLRFWVFRSG